MIKIHHAKKAITNWLDRNLAHTKRLERRHQSQRDRHGFARLLSALAIYSLLKSHDASVT